MKHLKVLVAIALCLQLSTANAANFREENLRDQRLKPTEECLRVSKHAYLICRNETASDGGYGCYLRILHELNCLHKPPKFISLSEELKHE